MKMPKDVSTEHEALFHAAPEKCAPQFAVIVPRLSARDFREAVIHASGTSKPASYVSSLTTERKNGGWTNSLRASFGVAR